LETIIVKLLQCRRLLKERQVEDAEFGDMPKFVTTAYKKKLMEDSKWEYEDRLADAVERNTTAETRGMHGFLSNLLTKNIAMGADVETSAVSAYTADSSRQRRKLEEEGGEDSGDGSKSAASPQRFASAKRSHEHISKDDLEVDSRDAVGNNKAGPSAVLQPTGEVWKEGATTMTTDIPAAAPPPVAAVPTVSKEDAVKAAKERYLARKMMQQN
jgi:hypothetical protein